MFNEQAGNRHDDAQSLFFDSEGNRIHVVPQGNPTKVEIWAPSEIGPVHLIWHVHLSKLAGRNDG